MLDDPHNLSQAIFLPLHCLEFYLPLWGGASSCLKVQSQLSNLAHVTPPNMGAISKKRYGEW